MISVAIEISIELDERAIPVIHDVLASTVDWLAFTGLGST